MDGKQIELFAELWFSWGWGNYLPTFQKLVGTLLDMGYKVTYDLKKTREDKQEVYLVKGNDKILVYSKVSTKKFLDYDNSKEVAEKIIGLLK